MARFRTLWAGLCRSGLRRPCSVDDGRSRPAFTCGDAGRYGILSSRVGTAVSDLSAACRRSSERSFWAAWNSTRSSATSFLSPLAAPRQQLPQLGRIAEVLRGAFAECVTRFRLLAAIRGQSIPQVSAIAPCSLATVCMNVWASAKCLCVRSWT